MSIAPRDAAWLGALQALLPPGQALPRDPDAVFTRLLAAIAARLASAEARFAHLLAQMDPRQATDLLTDWERLLGLPDDCSPIQRDVAQRQQVAFARLTELGGQSPAYFIALAASIGEPGVTITEFRPLTCNSTCNGTLHTDADAHNWRVNLPSAAQDVRTMTCTSPCDDALQSYTASGIECVFNARKPAHTGVAYAYPDPPLVT